MKEKVEKGRLNPNIVDGVYIKDTVYDNPSYAANIILGNNKNGWTNWKNDEGITLNDLSGRRVLNEDKLLKKSSLDIINVYNKLQEKLLNISEDVKVKYLNSYIAFCIDNNFIEIHPKKDYLECYTVNKEIEYGDLDIARVPETNKWTVDTKFYIKSIDDISKYWQVIIDSYNNRKTI